MNEYEGSRRVIYSCGDAIGNAVFVPVCEKCSRFVKADDAIFVNENTGLKDVTNAICSRCGPTRMLFEGFFGDDEIVMR